MSNEKKNLPDGADGQEHDAEQGVEAPNVGVGAETDAEGSSQSPEEKLERIAEEHDVPIEKDPNTVQAEAEAEGSSDEERDMRGGDTKEEEETSSEPPD